MPSLVLKACHNENTQSIVCLVFSMFEFSSVKVSEMMNCHVIFFFILGWVLNIVDIILEKR